MQRILLTLLLGIILVPAVAQEYAPKAGDKQVSLLLGNGMFYSGGSNYMLQIDKTDAITDMTLSNPTDYLQIADPHYNDITNMLGVELKYFITDAIAVGFTGAGYISSTPGRAGIQGVPAAEVPSYGPVEAQLGSRAAVSFSGFYHFDVGHERISPYGGIQATFQFGSLSAEQAFDPSNPADVGYGPRTGQVYGWSPAIVGGIEYSLQPGFIIGFEVKPVSYYHSTLALYAQPGLEALHGSNAEYAFFTQPRFKFAFRF